MRILLYITVIIVANLLTAAIPPSYLFGLLIPTGSWLIGVTFILRDWVQQEHGKKNTYFIIFIALLASVIVTILTGNGFMVVIASLAAFAISEFADTEVFSRLKQPITRRVLISGVVGGVLDSIVFVLVAGFPTQAIFGQMIVKVVMQIIGFFMIVLVMKIKVKDN